MRHVSKKILLLNLVLMLALPMAAGCGGTSSTGPDCVDHSDCDDQLVCNGSESCDEGVCAAGEAVGCQENAECQEPSGVCLCDPGYLPEGDSCVANPCALPRPQVLSVIHQGALLSFSGPDGMPIQVGTAADPEAEQPDSWLDQDHLTLPQVDSATLLRVFARIDHESCVASGQFAFTYELRPAYPGPAGQEDSRAVAHDDPAIVGWSTAVADVDFGEEVDLEWQTPENALGEVVGGLGEVVCLGQGGSITLLFNPPIADGPGPDFAVFENAFQDAFLEFALVEVSSDGSRFVTFDHAFLGQEAIGQFGLSDTGQVGSMAGKYRQAFGTPFDLAVFAQSPEVLQGLLDLNSIVAVRIVDVVGDGNTSDSFGQPIYDPYPDTGSAGFDLDGVGVLNAANF